MSELNLGIFTADNYLNYYDMSDSENIKLLSSNNYSKLVRDLDEISVSVERKIIITANGITGVLIIDIR